MRGLACLTTLAAAASPWLMGTSCAPLAPSGDASAYAPVYIAAVQGLTPPLVGYERAYHAPTFDIDPLDPAAGQTIGFRLTVATADPAALRARLSDPATGAVHELQPVDPPALGEKTDGNDAPRPFNTTIQDLLKAGIGAFWLDDPSQADGPLMHTFAFLIPESARGPRKLLTLFTAVTHDGKPLHADRIELVRGFFYLAVLGDSVAWGNGLLDQDKYHAIVADEIERRTGRKVIRQVLALSGARIVPAPSDGLCDLSCYREAPAVSTSITAQLDLVACPDLIDLVLMDGCINDVTVAAIIDPDTPTDDLLTRSAQFCRDEMAELIRKVRDRIPRAPIVVTGYYPIIAPASDLLGLATYYQTQDIPSDENLARFIEGAAANSATFLDASTSDLAAAVDDALDARPGGPAILFVDPAFTPDNALFTPGSLLWGLTADATAAAGLATDLQLFPEDPQLPTRISACLKAAGAQPSLGCLYASVGHPNRQGARRYADAVLDALQSAGALPAGADNP